MHLGIVSCLCAALGVLAAATAWAAPPPPPGGHIPIHFGGNNRAGYPALNQPLAAPPPTSGATTALAVIVTPNPFRGAIQFRFSAHAGERTRIRVFAPDGRLVSDLSTRGEPGSQVATWDGRDRQGRRMPASVYIYRVDAGTRTASGKLVYIR